MRVAEPVALLVLMVAGATAQSPLVTCDADSDCWYVPEMVGSHPALLVLHCNGAVPADIDSLALIGDSLGWVLAACHASRNHRDPSLNDADIVRTAVKLRTLAQVDTSRVFVFGYSGQGVQALSALFLHPELFRGAVSVCGHRGAMELVIPELVASKLVYLVTREADWNRVANLSMAGELSRHGLDVWLESTPGEHQPGTRYELLRACRWLGARSSQ